MVTTLELFLDIGRHIYLCSLGEIFYEAELIVSISASVLLSTVCVVLSVKKSIS